MDTQSLADQINTTAETLDTIIGKLQGRRDELDGNQWIKDRMKELIDATDQLAHTHHRFTELIEVTGG